MADAPGDAVGHQPRQCTVDGRARLAQNTRQFRRIDERHLAEGTK